jgi:hypothetical protein
MMTGNDIPKLMPMIGALMTNDPIMLPADHHQTPATTWINNLIPKQIVNSKLNIIICTTIFRLAFLIFSLQYLTIKSK